MKTCESRTVVETYESCTGVTCDLCDTHFPGDGRWATESAYEIRETKVSLKTGRNFPEGGCGDLINVDICPGCFKNKLIPWLESEGAKIQYSEWDW